MNRDRRVIIWSITGIVAVLLAVVALALVVVELNVVANQQARVKQTAVIACRQDNTTREALVNLVHFAVKVPPNAPPDESLAIQGFLNETDRRLADHPC